MSGEVRRGRFADFWNAQREKEPGKRCLLAVLYSLKEVAGGLFSHAVQGNKLLHGQGVDISRCPDDGSMLAPAYQLLDDLRAQAFDIHGAPRCKMPQFFFTLRGTYESA